MKSRRRHKSVALLVSVVPEYDNQFVQHTLTRPVLLQRTLWTNVVVFGAHVLPR